MSLSTLSVAPDPAEALLAKLYEERTHRKRAEQELAALRHELHVAQANALRYQSRLTALAQNLKMGIMLVDDAARVLMINRPYCQLFGISEAPESLYGATGLEIAARSQHNHPDPAAYLARVVELRAAGRTLMNEEVILADGRVLERDYIVLDDALAGRLVCYRDITIRYRRNARANTISLLAQQSPNPILRLTPGGELLYANPAAYPLAQLYKLDGSPNELHTQLVALVALALRTASHHQREISVANEHYLLIVAPVPGETYASLYFTNITARHRAEEKLGAQREFYETVLNQLPADIEVLDAHGHYVFVNPVSIQDPGIREWIIGKTELEHCAYRQHATDVAENRQRMFERAVRERSQVTWEESAAGTHGPRYVLRRFHPVFYPNGTLHLMLAYGLDITERHQAEKLHRRSELIVREQQEFIRQIVDTIPNLLYVNDEAGDIMFSNMAFDDLVSRSNHDRVGTDAESAPEAFEMRQFTALNRQVLASQQEQSAEMLFTLASGEVRHYQVVKRPLIRPEGTVQVLTVSTDITEVKRIRHTLERKAKQYRDLMQYTQALICTHDLDGVILSANPALANLMGVSVHNMVGRNPG
ncbi:putative PAS/PAC sensor protein [Hymenobacter roseosalivarius DSM 11622]|uniref:Putative PAS/PAC sensor protein n=1 Tax=Hymenobacter roseosalivarius DSM 11622 TaxID=645990 RepID=A0A1W1VJV1_9BACT|nr:PAS domain-containing protein [Hymenobacter roseosalivarius]SMB93608.1 putative PAS/PAC sensor protein [Hymenobacter roseosalivarius DSM 11622]